jgi:hypothetical protein
MWLSKMSITVASVPARPTSGIKHGKRLHFSLKQTVQRETPQFLHPWFPNFRYSAAGARRPKYRPGIWTSRLDSGSDALIGLIQFFTLFY